MAETKSFIFNLLTPKSKEEVQSEEQRDTSSFYAAVLPLVGALLWVGITVVNVLIIQNYITSWNSRILAQNVEIQSYSDVKGDNGELYLKAGVLGDVVSKNVDPDQLFEVIEGTINSISPSIEILQYGREEDGKFSVSANTRSFMEVSRVVRAFTGNESFINVELETVSKDLETGQIRFSLAFEFVGQEN